MEQPFTHDFILEPPATLDVQILSKHLEPVAAKFHGFVVAALVEDGTT
jgi:hypothetical protein